jgi:hypothetical protein
MLVALRESILDNSDQRKGFLSLDVILLIRPLFSTRNFRVVKIFLEKHVWVVVYLSSLDRETIPQPGFMAMIEDILVRVVLLPHARITAIKGEIRNVGHFDGWMSEGEKEREAVSESIIYTRSCRTSPPARLTVPHRKAITE